jgi:hypothetical protein
MFRPSLGHPQALKESRSMITYMFYRNALWDPKRLQNVIEVQYKFDVVLTVHRRYYVEIKCQLDATDEFLLQILVLAQHVSGTAAAAAARKPDTQPPAPHYTDNLKTKH